MLAEHASPSPYIAGEDVERSPRSPVRDVLGGVAHYAARVRQTLEREVKLTPAATEFLVEHGYDQSYGARPLKRSIQRYIEDPLSERILMGDFGRGDEIEVDVAPDGERLAFRALTSTQA